MKTLIRSGGAGDAGGRGVAQGGQARGLLPVHDPQAVAQGHRIHAAHCAACHGDDLQGQPDWRRPDADGFMPAPPHDETGHTWHHPDAVLIRITTLGTAAVVGQGYRSRMPGFADILDETEIRAVLAYVKSTWPAQVIDMHDRINREAGG